MNTPCPCCGRAVERNLPLVSPETLTVAYGDGAVKLSPQQMVIAEMLVKHWPATVHSDRLMLRMWATHEPERPVNTLRTQVHHVRAMMQLLGFDVVPVWGNGYRLERRRPGAVKQAATR